MKTLQQSPVKMNARVSFTDTFQSSQQEKQPKYHIDRSLAKGIMENNSSLIVDEQPQSNLTNQGVFNTEDQQDKIAFQFRAKYDKTKSQTLFLGQKINKMKEQLQILKQKNKSLLQDKQITTKNFNQYQTYLDDQVYNLQQTILRHDNMKYMEERLSKDIIFFQKQKYQNNLQLLKLRSQLNRMKQKSQRQQRLSLRCNTLLSSVQKTYNLNGSTRQKGLQNISQFISVKKQIFIKQHERQISYQKSMIEAMNTKLPQERQLLKMLNTNKFLKKLLNYKMNKLMSEYKQVNDAFSKIKQNTSVKNIKQFIYKFLNKDQLYGQLLQSISTTQPRIQDLKQQQKQLQSINQYLQHQHDQIIQLSKKNNQNNDQKLMKDIDKYNNTLLQIDKYRNSITIWAISTISLFRGVSKSEVRSKYNYLSDIFSDCLKLILKTIQSDQTYQKSISQKFIQKQSVKNNISTLQLTKKNIRIKTLGNQAHKQEEDIEYDLRSQKDFMNGLRRAIKKNRLVKPRILSKN